MRTKTVLVALVAAFLTLSFAGDTWARSRSSSGGSASVRGYTTKSGKTVAPYQRTTPNGSKQDNWSAKGNVNPYTGKSGTKNPY